MTPALHEQCFLRRSETSREVDSVPCYLGSVPLTQFLRYGFTGSHSLCKLDIADDKRDITDDTFRRHSVLNIMRWVHDTVCIVENSLISRQLLRRGSLVQTLLRRSAKGLAPRRSRMHVCAQLAISSSSPIGEGIDWSSYGRIKATFQ